MAQQLRLSDGRCVEYQVYGPKDGFPLVWIHGTPGSFIPVPDVLSACEKKGLSLIALSRAGYGGSTRKPGRSVVDCVADLQALNEHLGVKKCVVGGWSGGGPVALACAARLQGCVAAVCGAGVAPYDAEGLDFLAGQGQDNIDEFNAALQGEEALQKFCTAQRAELLNADVAGVIKAMSSILPTVDKDALTNSTEMGQHMVDSMNEGLKNNCDGWVDDDLAFTRPWGFDLGEIKVPVLLYQGDEDKMVPFAHGQWLAEHLPQDKLRKHLLQGQGHISIFVGRSDAIIDELLEVAKVV